MRRIWLDKSKGSALVLTEAQYKRIVTGGTIGDVDSCVLCEEAVIRAKNKGFEYYSSSPTRCGCCRLPLVGTRVSFQCMEWTKILLGIDLDSSAYFRIVRWMRKHAKRI